MPITHDEFIRKYDGKFVEVAGSANAKNQCVDLANAYLKEVLNQPIVEWTNARDFPSKLKENFNWFNNDPEAIPEKGDLMIWQHNEWGHIAICDTASLNEFNSFDQNYPTGTPCHIQRHTYLRPKVAGWLRLKNAGEPKIYTESQMTDMREQRDENHRKFIAMEETANARKKELENFRSKLAEKLTLPSTSDEADIIGAVERAIVSEDELVKAKKIIKEKDEAYDKLKKEFEEKFTQMERDFKRLQNDFDNLSNKYRELEQEKPDFTPKENPILTIINKVLSIFK
jgi:hypothetical protein